MTSSCNLPTQCSAALLCAVLAFASNAQVPATALAAKPVTADGEAPQVVVTGSRFEESYDAGRPIGVTVLIFAATRVLSYGVFFFTLYSLGLRLGEGLRLQLGDIDAARSRVHVRDAKGNKDRLVPLPQTTLELLRRFWQTHRNPVPLFPNRHAGLNGAASATTPLDRGECRSRCVK